VSSDRAALQRFAAEHGRVVCKSISHGLVAANGNTYAVHTREVSSDQLAEGESLGGVPLLVQRCVPKGVDIRVTIMGDKAYSVEIVVPLGSPIDWRATREGLSYRLCNLPTEVYDACQSFMRELRLLYGAFDFVRTDDGDWYFLEVNPAGEWAWLDLELGLSMRDKLIDLLYGN
jgi:glutathione synthase/RimK-type ligase-like ATP-grasp enzyme